MTERTVLYHANCRDGFCAAWLFNRLIPGCNFVAAEHGKPPPNLEGHIVYIADFCYPFDQLTQIYSQCSALVILDHHISNAETLTHFHDSVQVNAIDKPIDIFFDIGKSGGRLAWEYLWRTKLDGPSRTEYVRRKLFNESISLEKAPWLVDYTEDRDLWRNVLPYTKEVSAALLSYPFDFGVWDKIYKRQFGIPSVWQSFLMEGMAVLRMASIEIKRAIANAREISIRGHHVLCANALSHASEIAGELAISRPFGACYFDSGKVRVFQLRSTEDGIDVSEIAKHFGGGGHKRAAGFSVPCHQVMATATGNPDHEQIVSPAR